MFKQILKQMFPVSDVKRIYLSWTKNLKICYLKIFLETSTWFSKNPENVFLISVLTWTGSVKGASNDQKEEKVPDKNLFQSNIISMI